MVAVEALSAGAPVVAFASGALPEIVRHGIDGLLVPRGDAEALRQAVGQLLTDEAARRRMSEAAMNGAARFSPDVVIPRIEQAYSDVLEMAGSR